MPTIKTTEDSTPFWQDAFGLVVPCARGNKRGGGLLMHLRAQVLASCVLLISYDGVHWLNLVVLALSLPRQVHLLRSAYCGVRTK